MRGESLDIDILCKVVDNFGDIGVAYRLARALSALPEAPRLRLIVDDLRAFSAVEPAVDPSLERQTVRGWELFRWELSAEAIAAFAARPPRRIIQCFACPRPDWLEAILFAPEAERSLMVDLDYLTAEDYAAEFHLMPSLTRSERVAKLMFHPGFTAGTGGLIIDPPFAAARARAARAEGRAAMRRELLGLPALAGTELEGTELSRPAIQAGTELGGTELAGHLGTELAGHLGTELADCFWTLIFSYERDYFRVVADLAAFNQQLRAASADGCCGDRARLDEAPHGDRAQPSGIFAFVAAGKSRDCFISAWRAAGRPFPLVELPFLPQETWDRLLLSCDFSIVRGEESWSRAALSGRPFLWQAYPQDGRHHMVKVEAFLARLCPHFPKAGFESLAAAYRAFNDRDRDSPETSGNESILPLLEALSPLARSPLAEGFHAFADSVFGLGDLARGLVDTLKARSDPTP
jgi:hypothetical protein